MVQIGFLIYLFSQTFFLLNIQFPRSYNFDEFHYIPAAKQFLEHKLNKNWEHPPLGKLILAAGISIGGDRPIGWRCMSTFFGALTLVGLYALSLVLFRDLKTALWITFLTLFNQLLYVQARIGMLDTFMFAFLVWAMAAFCATWDPRNNCNQNRRLFLLTGILLGLSAACKWFALVPWISFCLLISLVRLLQGWQTQFKQPLKNDWYHPNLWKGISWTDWLFTLVGVPIFFYSLTYIPYFFIPEEDFSIYKIFTSQPRMWQGQLHVVTTHPYMSQWTDWAILKRPIWYAFEHEGAQNRWVRGVLLLGNPLIMWSGLLAVLVCAWEWIQRRDKTAFFIFYFYSIYYFSWAIIPRKILFYYYYYPAGMVLSLACAYVFHHPAYQKLLRTESTRWIFLGASILLFVYFSPILAALKIPSNSFPTWMWFPSWI